MIIVEGARRRVELPDLESKIEKKVKATAKQNESRLQSIEKQVQ
jgi:site-specific DNA recombinase